MQETAPPWAFPDALGSRRGVPTREVSETRRDDLEAQLARATGALSEAEARHRSALAAAAEQLADQKAAYELALARNAAIWEMVEEQLREAALGVERARQGQATAVATADRATRRAAELESETAREIEARRDLEQALTSAEARHAAALAAAAERAGELQSALQRSNEEIESRAADIRRLAEQEASLTSQLAQAVTSRAEFERQLQVTQAAIHEADARATRERLAAYQRAAEREAELDGQLRSERDARAEIERAAIQAEAAAREELQRRQDALVEATTQIAELRARFERDLLEMTSARDAATEQLRSVEAALDQLRRDHESQIADLTSASQQRETDLLARVTEQKVTIEVLECQVSENASALRDARRHETALDEQLQHERSGRAELERAAAEAETAAREELERCQQALVEATTTITELADRASRQQVAIEELERQAADSASQIWDAGTREAALVRDLQVERDQRAEVERAAAEAETAAREELERRQQALTEATTQMAEIRVRSERELSEMTSAHDGATERLRSTEAALERLRQDHESEVASLTGASQQREAELVARVSAQQAAIEAFERQVADHVEAIHDAGTREATLDETLQLERATRSALEVDLANVQRMLAASQDKASQIERERNAIGAELEAVKQRLEAAESEAAYAARLRERLELAGRMEAVGRLASEAAATCGNLLADVHQNVQQWLMAGGDPVIRQRGESVLDDVTHAAGLIRQLAGYVEESGRTPTGDLVTTIRDLEPVLRRVAGQDVELRLPENTGPIRLDQSSERVDRLLVNLASYGRERMPEGGRLTIELTTVDVDREFAARHTTVRAGAHALITMTKSRSKDDDQGQNGIGPRPKGRSGRTPGVELGTLQSQVGECGGHLWMTIDPQGDIVSKLHLPLPNGRSEVH